MPRIQEIFFDTDLRNGLDGLIDVAKKRNVDIDKLKKGDFLVFVNTKRDKMRLVPCKDLFANYRSPTGRIELNMIRHIPEYFDGSELGFSKALEKALREKGIGGEK